MADTGDPQNKKEAHELPTAVPIPKPIKVSGCTLAVAIAILLVVIVFGLLVGACWR